MQTRSNCDPSATSRGSSSEDNAGPEVEVTRQAGLLDGQQARVVPDARLKWVDSHVLDGELRGRELDVRW